MSPDGSATDGSSTGPDVFDHLRVADGADIQPGVYRVVGTTADAVTLLRVADADGRRRHTGAVVTVSRTDLSALEPASDPDASRSLTAVIATQLQGLYWTARSLARTVRERPVPAVPALALVVLGLFGDAAISFPEHADTVLALVGLLALLSLSRSG